MLFPKVIHRFFFLFGFAVSLCALPFSPFVLSVGLITIMVNWVIDGEWMVKYHRFLNRKSLWLFLLVYGSSLIGIIYSQNIGYALKELRLWLPLLLVPIIVTTSSPLERKEIRALLILFCSAVFVGSLISLSIFIRDYSTLGQDSRYLSPFISHIRFALMIDLAICLLIYLAVKNGYLHSWLIKSIFISVAIWLVAFLLILQSATGIIILFIVVPVVVFRWIFTSKDLLLRYILFVAFAFLLLFTCSRIAHSIDRFFTREKVDYYSLPRLTANGNSYVHDSLNQQYENGNLIWINICYPELKQGWDGAKKCYSNTKLKSYEEVEQILIRYITSKGLRKDSLGIAKLDFIDIQQINNGVTSIIYRDHRLGIYPRLYQILWEIDLYNTSGVASGSTIMQRFIYLKSSWQVVKKNFMFGVGLGDGKDTLLEYYKTSKINLDSKYWFLSHNQYLTVWIGVGLFGLILFLVGLLSPFFYEHKYTCIPCLVFLVILLMSMLTEDTLETHIGVSFAAIFYSIFIFGYDFQKESE